jgi:hypothetical protein
MPRDLSNYVPVSERLEQFWRDCPEGRILTEIAEHDREAGFILIRASIYRTRESHTPAATGHAYEQRGDSHVNTTSYVENCETSAVGRALALLGYEIKRGIASREEMAKVERHGGGKVTPATPPNRVNVPRSQAATPAQLNYLRKLCQAQGLPETNVAARYSGGIAAALEHLAGRQASAAINGLQEATTQISQPA